MRARTAGGGAGVGVEPSATPGTLAGRPLHHVGSAAVEPAGIVADPPGRACGTGLAAAAGGIIAAIAGAGAAGASPGAAEEEVGCRSSICIADSSGTVVPMSPALGAVRPSCPRLGGAPDRRCPLGLCRWYPSSVDASGEDGGARVPMRCRAAEASWKPTPWKPWGNCTGGGAICTGTPCGMGRRLWPAPLRAPVASGPPYPAMRTGGERDPANLKSSGGTGGKASAGKADVPDDGSRPWQLAIPDAGSMPAAATVELAAAMPSD